jgi:uncharacterized membrane protein YesL
MNFFSLDGKFYRFGTWLVDIAFIGVLWTLFSLPLVTMGAATTGMYYVCTKRHTGHDGYIFAEFWKSFKENFWKSTIIFIGLAGAGFLLWMNLHILDQLELARWLTILIRVVIWFVLFQLAMVATQVFAILSRFDVDVKTALKYGLFLGYRHFLTTISLWVTLLAIFMITVFVPVLLFLMGGLYVYFSSKSLVKIFRKNSAEFDDKF